MRKPTALLLIFLVAFSAFTFLRFSFVVVYAFPTSKWLNRYTYSTNNTDGSITDQFSIEPQVFWNNQTNDWGELEFVKNDTYPYFITWASVANTTYFVRNSHIALEVTNNSYVKLWNPDYNKVSVYSERWVVESLQPNQKWKDTGVGAQPNSWSISQDLNSVNITRIQKLVGVGELNVTYIIRKGMYLKHEIVFKSLDYGGGLYRVVMQWAGITNNKVKTQSEEFIVVGETHKVSPYFLVGQDGSSMVVQEFLESVYPNLTDIVFNTHAQGIKTDVILGNWTLALNGQLVIDPNTSTFDVVSDTYDAFVYYYGGVGESYSNVHNNASGTTVDTTGVGLGQGYSPPDTFAIYRAFLLFDTSSLPDEATITTAILRLYGSIDISTNNFVIRIQNWTEASDGISVADYNGFDGVNYDDGLFDTSSYSVSAYNNISFSIFTLINLVANTSLCIRSSKDVLSTVPAFDVAERVYAQDTGAANPAKLVVTYSTIAPEYDYIDSQTNVDSSADKGTHSSFAAQQATDWTNDTLTEANTNTTVLNNAENFVDANTSNIDSHTGHGTSSNFTAQQDANVAYNDTLTEANTAGTTSDVFTDGFEDGTFGKWDGNGATTWGDGATFMATNSSPGTPWVTHSGTYMVDADANDDGNLTSDSIDASAVQAIGISFWYMNDDGDGDDFSFQVYDGSTWDRITWLGDSGTTNEDVWLKYTWVSTDSQYFDATFRFGFTAGFASNEGGFIDDVTVNMTTNNNYELDYEFSWTTTDFDEANEYLCIRTNSYTGTVESLGVDVWDGSWKSVSTALTASSWNNISITTNLTGATIYFRFIGKTESSDTAQNTWIIECNLIHTWSVGVNYELDLEEQFTSANFSRTNVELCIRMGSQSGSEVLSLDYWNASSSAWIVTIATLTMNQWNNVSVKTYTSNASVTFTVKLVDNTQSGDTVLDTWNKDACLLHTWDVTGDSIKPTYSGISANSTVWATSCNFSVTINDETALHPNGQYIFGCNNTGTPTNETAINFTTTSQFISIAKTLNSTNPNATSPMIVQFQWWFTDNAGNQNNTGLQTLTLCWQLSVGWNNVTIFEFDAGYTLSGTNASLNYDSINWSYIVYQNSSTTAQYVFVKNMAANNLVRVYQTTGILLIFCNQAGNWTHTYPYQGGDYGEDPTPYIVAATISMIITGLAYSIYKWRKKKHKVK